MRKETIIEIILSTMDEMRKLTETFADKENIPQPFIDLLTTKYSTLGKEIQLLEFWKEDNADKNAEPVATEVAPEPVIVEITPEPNIEPEVVSAPEPEPVVEIEITPEPVVEPVVEPEPEPVPTPTPVVTIEVEEKKEEAIEPKVTVEPIKVEKPAAPVKQAKALSSKDAIEYGTPVADIRKAVGINDRFLFQRELFGGDASMLNQTLDAINACNSYNEAHEMLKKFHWDETDATVEGFLKAVHRRFL